MLKSVQRRGEGRSRIQIACAHGVSPCPASAVVATLPAASHRSTLLPRCVLRVRMCVRVRRLAAAHFNSTRMILSDELRLMEEDAREQREEEQEAHRARLYAEH